ncbi:hypothetical protein HGE68_08990 [Rhodobacteraceae bacterium R_SAG6]|nr:hypothetical protein [Rhodobacteraceae bacterium G21628-S1]NKX30006.1 hypothetical protein [Rhodobacteraceae bacterium R_SAG6]
MKRGTLCFIACSALCFFPPQGHAEKSSTRVSFDTEGFLKECTRRVLGGVMQIPMNQRCVSTALQLCSLSAGELVTEQCLLDVTLWLNGDSARIGAEIADADLTVRQLEERSDSQIKDLVPDLSSTSDCSQMNIEGVSSEAACTYATSLSTWFKLRVLEQSGPISPD